MDSTTFTIAQLKNDNERLKDEVAKLKKQLESSKKATQKWKSRCNTRSAQTAQMRTLVQALTSKVHEEQARNINTSSVEFKQNCILHEYIMLPKDTILRLAADTDIDFALKQQFICLIPWEDRETFMQALMFTPSQSMHMANIADLGSVTFGFIFQRSMMHINHTIHGIVQYKVPHSLVQCIIGTATDSNQVVLRICQVKPSPIIHDCLTLGEASAVLKKPIEDVLEDVWIINLQQGQALPLPFTFLSLKSLLTLSLTHAPHQPLYPIHNLQRVNHPVILQQSIAKLRDELLSQSLASAASHLPDTLVGQDYGELFPVDGYGDINNASFSTPLVSQPSYEVPKDPSKLFTYFVSNPAPYIASFPTHPSVSVLGRFVNNYATPLISAMMSNPDREWFPKTPSL